MFWLDLVWASVLALLLALLLSGPLRWRHPAAGEGPAVVGLLFLFLVFFFAIWAGGVWLTPFGPVLAGGYWLPFLLVGLFVLLLLAAVSPPARRPRTPAEAQAETEEAEAAGTIMTVFFWILLIGLVAAIIIAYMR